MAIVADMGKRCATIVVLVRVGVLGVPLVGVVNGLVTVGGGVDLHAVVVEVREVGATGGLLRVPEGRVDGTRVVEGLVVDISVYFDIGLGSVGVHVRAGRGRGVRRGGVWREIEVTVHRVIIK